MCAALVLRSIVGVNRDELPRFVPTRPLIAHHVDDNAVEESLDPGLAAKMRQSTGQAQKDRTLLFGSASVPECETLRQIAHLAQKSE